MVKVDFLKLYIKELRYRSVQAELAACRTNGEMAEDLLWSESLRLEDEADRLEQKWRERHAKE